MPYAYRGTTLIGSFRTLLYKPCNVGQSLKPENRLNLIFRFTTPRQVQSIIGLRCTNPQLSLPNNELLLLLIFAFENYI